MISNTELQNAYVELYKILRNYIWDYNTVVKIADLEIACFQTCPNLGEVKFQLSRLKLSCINTIHEDEDLLGAFDEFDELLNSSNTYYVKIDKVNEVIQNEDNEE